MIKLALIIIVLSDQPGVQVWPVKGVVYSGRIVATVPGYDTHLPITQYGMSLSHDPEDLRKTMEIILDASEIYLYNISDNLEDGGFFADIYVDGVVLVDLFEFN